MAGLAGFHPLRGPNVDELGPRFLALSDAYDLALRRTAHQAWARLVKADVVKKQRLSEGVYAFVCGPRYDEPFARQERERNLRLEIVMRHEPSAACSNCLALIL